MMTRELTGRHVLAIVVTAFAVIIGVNVFMAWKAVSTFAGLEVKNSYVASQTWDAEQKAQEALGWTLSSTYDEAAHEMRLTFTGKDGLPVLAQDLSVLIGRPTSNADDQQPDFNRKAGVLVAPVDLGPGKWVMQVNARATDGTPWRGRLSVFVKGPGA